MFLFESAAQPSLLCVQIIKKGLYAGQAGISIDYALAVTQSLTMLVSHHLFLVASLFLLPATSSGCRKT